MGVHTRFSARVHVHAHTHGQTRASRAKQSTPVEQRLQRAAHAEELSDACARVLWSERLQRRPPADRARISGTRSRDARRNARPCSARAPLCQAPSADCATGCAVGRRKSSTAGGADTGAVDTSRQCSRGRAELRAASSARKPIALRSRAHGFAWRRLRVCVRLLHVPPRERVDSRAHAEWVPPWRSKCAMNCSRTRPSTCTASLLLPAWHVRRAGSHQFCVPRSLSKFTPHEHRAEPFNAFDTGTHGSCRLGYRALPPSQSLQRTSPCGNPHALDGMCRKTALLALHFFVIFSFARWRRGACSWELRFSAESRVLFETKFPSFETKLSKLECRTSAWP